MLGGRVRTGRATVELLHHLNGGVLVSLPPRLCSGTANT